MNNEQGLFKISVEPFFKVVKAIRNLRDDATFKLSLDGLKAVEIDTANVALINAEIKQEGFIEWFIDKEIKLGLDTKELYNALKSNKKGLVSVSKTENEIYLKFDNGIKTKLLMIDSENKRDMPMLEYKAEVLISSKQLKDVLQHFINTGESLVFQVNDEKEFIVLSEKSNAVIDKYEIKTSGKAKARYSCEYLKKFIKLDIDGKTILKFSDDAPLSFLQEKEGLKVGYILAPRVGGE